MAARIPELKQDEHDPSLYKPDINEILLPFYISITQVLTVGTELIVRGEVAPKADTFSINLMRGECSPGRFPESGCLIHFNPRLNKKVVVINSAVDGKWQKEERKGYSFPFSKGGEFKVVIRMQSLGYQILVDDRPFCDFVRKETQCSKAKYIHIKGDVHIRSVEVRYPSSPQAVTYVNDQGKSGKASGSASLTNPLFSPSPIQPQAVTNVNAQLQSGKSSGYASLAILASIHRL